MKRLYVTILLPVLAICYSGYSKQHAIKDEKTIKQIKMDSLLRHVVLFKFKEGTHPKDIQKVTDAFAALPDKISQIYSYEWGMNNSPEHLNKGFTHSFFITFKSEEDRAIYLPHPDHKAFGSILQPYLEDVLVIDYWTTNP